MVKAIALSLLVVLVIIAGATVAAGAYVLSAGVGTVQVRTTGPEAVDLYLPVPVGLVDLGLSVASFAVPEEELAQLRHEMEDWPPLLESVTRELARCPDGTLVEVHTRDEKVLIVKDRGRLKIDVDAPDARVRVSLPARSLVRIGRKLDDLVDL